MYKTYLEGSQFSVPEKFRDLSKIICQFIKDSREMGIQWLYEELHDGIQWWSQDFPCEGTYARNLGKQISEQLHENNEFGY